MRLRLLRGARASADSRIRPGRADTAFVDRRAVGIPSSSSKPERRNRVQDAPGRAASRPAEVSFSTRGAVIRVERLTVGPRAARRCRRRRHGRSGEMVRALATMACSDHPAMSVLLLSAAAGGDSGALGACVGGELSRRSGRVCGREARGPGFRRVGGVSGSPHRPEEAGWRPNCAHAAGSSTCSIASARIGLASSARRRPSATGRRRRSRSARSCA